MTEFKGRTLVPGSVEAEALVSRTDFNIPKAFKKALASSGGRAICADPVSEDIYRKEISGMALCLPAIEAEDRNAEVLLAACNMECNPCCMLFAEQTDIAPEGLTMPVIDSLGDKFLDFVKDGMTITVTEDGAVQVDEEIKPTRESIRRKKRKKAVFVYLVSFVIAVAVALSMYLFKDRISADIIDYTNKDRKKINALHTEVTDKIINLSDECDTGEEIADYYDKELIPIYDQILKECYKVEYRTKEVGKLHGIYIEYIKKEREICVLFADAVKNNKPELFDKREEVMKQSDKLFEDFLSLRDEYGKKYALTYSKKK